jgi:hypothetical protein
VAGPFEDTYSIELCAAYVASIYVEVIEPFEDTYSVELRVAYFASMYV